MKSVVLCVLLLAPTAAPIRELPTSLTSPTSPTSLTSPTSPTSPTVDTTITVRASSSTLEFDPPGIAAKQGTRVHLRFVNAGTLPHNLVIVRNEDDIDTLAAAASRAGGDFVPLALKNKLIAWTTLASPGQTVEVSFVMPPPGTYTYVCLMTGHTNSMMGTLHSLR